MKLPIVTINAIDGTTLSVYVKDGGMYRDTIVFVIDNEREIEVLMKDALHIAESIRVEYGIAHAKLREKILAYMLSEVTDNDEVSYR